MQRAPARAFVREETPGAGPPDLQFWLTVITVALRAFVTYMQTDVGVFAIGACVVVSAARRVFNALCGVSETDDSHQHGGTKRSSSNEMQVPQID